MHDNKGGLLKAWGICLLSGLLLGLSFPARAATNITSLTASPSSVTAGDVVAFDITITTTALETLAGVASGVLSRDGVTVAGAEFPGLLDLSNVGGGVIQASLPIDPALYSTPGAYELKVEISGEEDSQVPFADSASTTFDVKQDGGGNGGNPVDDAMQGIANTQPQSATAAVIGTICPKGIVAPRLQEDCNAMVGAALTPEGSNLNEDASMALGQVTTDQAATSVNASQTSVAAQNRNLASRISALQQGVRMGLSAGGLSFHLDGENLPAGQLAEDWMRQLANSDGGAAGSDSIFTSGRLGVFINGNVSLGDRDGTSNQEGFDYQTNGITLGADYRFTDQLALGAAIGYMNNNTDLDASGGGLDADGYSLSLYGTFFQDSGLYLDGIASFGRNNYDQRRNIRYNIGSVSVNQTASSDFDGDQWSASFGGGYSFSRGALAFGPTARIEYVNSDVDGFEETMSNPNADGGGWATRIEGQEVDSFTLQLGGDLSYAISQSWGVLLPQVHAEWVHEFEDDAENVVGHYILDPSNTAFSLNTDSPDTDYVNLRLGVSAQFAQGRSAYLYYRKLLGYRDLDVDSFSAGVRLEF